MSLTLSQFLLSCPSAIYSEAEGEKGTKSVKEIFRDFPEWFKRGFAWGIMGIALLELQGEFTHVDN
jgi:hypothetical protein